MSKSIEVVRCEVPTKDAYACFVHEVLVLQTHGTTWDRDARLPVSTHARDRREKHVSVMSDSVRERVSSLAVGRQPPWRVSRALEIDLVPF